MLLVKEARSEGWSCRRRDGGECVKGEGEREILIAVPRCFMILCALLQDLSLDVAYVKGGKKRKKKKRYVFVIRIIEGLG